MSSVCNEIVIDKCLEIFRCLLFFLTSQNQAFIDVFPKLINVFFFFTWIKSFFLENILIYSALVLSFGLFELIWISVELYFFKTVRFGGLSMFRIRALSIMDSVWFRYSCYLMEFTNILVQIYCFDACCILKLLNLRVIFCPHAFINDFLLSSSIFAEFLELLFELCPCYSDLNCGLDRATFLSSALAEDPFRTITGYFMSRSD